MNMKTAVFFCLALAAAGAQAAPSAIGAELGRRTLPKAARMSSSNAAFAQGRPAAVVNGALRSYDWKDLVVGK